MASLDPKRIERVLLVRLSAVGDIIHALPVLRALKAWRPGLCVDWLVEDRFALLLRNQTAIDRVFEIPRKRWRSGGGWREKASDARRLLCELRGRNIDLSIDLQGLTKSGLWPALARIPHRIGYGDEDGRELNRWLTNIKVSPAPDKKHVVDRNLALVEPLGIAHPEVDMSLPEDREAKARVETLLQQEGLEGEKLALIQPGAGWETKRWPPEYYAQAGDFLSRERGYRVLVLWGPGEEGLARQVLEAMREKGRLAPPTSLLELIELIRLSALFVGGDTGPMHIAAALRIPTVAIFGASDPVRNGPYGEGHLTLYHEDLACRPSWKTTCEHLTCLRDLKPEGVVERIGKYLGE